MVKYKPVQIPNSTKWKIVQVIDDEEIEVLTSREFDDKASASWSARIMMRGITNEHNA